MNQILKMWKNIIKLRMENILVIGEGKSIKYNHTLKYYSILSSSEEQKLNRINSTVTNIMMKIQKERVCLVASTICRSL